MGTAAESIRVWVSDSYRRYSAGIAAAAWTTPVFVRLLGVVPLFQPHAKVLPVCAVATSFALAGWVFYGRHWIATRLFGKPTTSPLTLALPPLVLLLAAITLTLYFQMFSGIVQALKDAGLPPTGEKGIPNSPALLVLSYLLFFVFWQLFFLLMWLREFSYKIRGLSERAILDAYST